MSPKRETSLKFISLIFFVSLTTTLVISESVDTDYQKKFYIVYLGDEAPIDEVSAARTHFDVLYSLKGSEQEAKESLVHSYHRTFNAFAARLSSHEAETLSEMEEVLWMYENQYHKLHTTKSWDFVGFPQSARRSLKGESNVIVALFDTGITPQSESFNDNGFGPPPANWKGSCTHNANFSGCNKIESEPFAGTSTSISLRKWSKIIGAKYFKLDGRKDPSDILSPIDVEGHGTHTSSTLAGRHVSNTSLFGLASGTARGAVPEARIAAYKVCWVSTGCSDMDILAAFDHAIADGVHVISISIGGPSPSYVTDSISIGSFHAMRKGIVTVGSGGNDGPAGGSVSNHAPWMITVAASGTDRGFRSRVLLGNGKSFEGIGIDLFETNGKSYDLVSGEDVARTSEDKSSARFCLDDSLSSTKVEGKIVLCRLENWGVESVVKENRGVGAIVSSPRYLDVAMVFMAPGTTVNYTVGERIDEYIHSTRSPSATIYKSKEVKVSAPFIGSFSSRGPNPGSLRLLKPDIAAPGIDILAAYTPLKSLTGLKGDTQHSKFNMLSGTSMACPHVAGVAAYVKSFHPKWSPAAIRSAIMTTATQMSSRINKDAEFAYGAGQVNPLRAVSPGLIYDIDEMTYIQFLCREGYNGSSLSVLTGSKSINCSTIIPGFGYDSLNYPTMQLSLKNKHRPTVGVFRRRVTNVGPSQSVYNATVKAPKGVEITVTPSSLSFSHAYQKRSFKVVVKASPVSGVTTMSASLIWKNARHVVRSPIVIYSV